MTECYDPAQISPGWPNGIPGYADDHVHYGNGLLHYSQQEFCDSNGVCDDVTVCKTDHEGEEKYYIPFRNRDGRCHGDDHTSVSNARGSRDVVRGQTMYDAYRLV